MNKLYILLFLIGNCIVLNAQQDSWQRKVDVEILDQLERETFVEVIIEMAEQADLQDIKYVKGKENKGRLVFERLKAISDRTQVRVKNTLAITKSKMKAFYVTNAVWAKVDEETLAAIAKFEEVKAVHANPSIKMEGPIAMDEPLLNKRGTIEWGILNISAEQVWEMGYQGQGVVVGGQDTGYEWTHPSLKKQYRGWDGTNADHNYNWHDAIHEINPLHGDNSTDPSLNPCGLDSKVPCDDHNHGTHTMGTMIGDDGGDNQIGVAPQAQWIAARNMERGYGSPATYIESFEWFLAPTDLNNENPDPTKAPHVINNSWSCPTMEGCNPSNWAMMEQVVENLKIAGIVVVVSAGNSGRQGCATVLAPAAMFQQSFSIGATQINDTIASFSSRGPVLVDGSGRGKPDISAPGVNVRSAVRGGGYRNFSGTSMAGPHAAGVVALILSANPSLMGEVELIENIIKETAKPLTSIETCGGTPGSAIPNNTYGYGRIDALAAVTKALLVSGNEQPLFQEVLVYPNPTFGQINFLFNSFSGEVNLQIFNSIGQEVSQQSWFIEPVGIQTLDISDLTNGYYFFTATNGDKRISGRFIKN